MKVHLKTAVFDRIYEKFIDAHRDRREVDFVTVTQDEYAELRHDRRSRDLLENPLAHTVPPQSAMDTVFQTRDFEDTRHGGSFRPKYRVASAETFMGKPLFVLPHWCKE